MAADPTLLSKLPAAVAAELQYPNLIAAGIEEAPIASMRHARLLQLAEHWPDSDYKTRLLSSTKRAAYAAAKRLRDRPELAEYYFKRAEMRSFLESMPGTTIDTLTARLAEIVHPNSKAGRAAAREAAGPVTIVLTPEEVKAQRMERLLALGREPLPPSLEEFAERRGEPAYGRYERSREAVEQRRAYDALMRDYSMGKKLAEQEARDQARRIAQLEAQLPAAAREATGPVVMRAAAYQALPPADKVLHDHLLLAAAGRPIPRASHHPLGHLPLHRRPGLR